MHILRVFHPKWSYKYTRYIHDCTSSSTAQGDLLSTANPSLRLKKTFLCAPNNTQQNYSKAFAQNFRCRCPALLTFPSNTRKIAITNANDAEYTSYIYNTYYTYTYY